MNGVPLQSRPRDWFRVNGRVSGIIRYESAGAFRVVFYRHVLKPDAGSLKGKRLLFFSDLHIRPQTTVCFPNGFSWQGAGAIRSFLLESIDRYQPDHLFFGGDMMAYLCNFAECADLFRSLHCPGMKIAVYGNWDVMRSWLPNSCWRQRLEEQSGLRFLVNEAVCPGGMRIFGLDEVRHGCPEYYPPETRPAFEVVLVHNPDTVPQALNTGMLKGIDLILCGHTHGGQIRIPLFGALACSSCHWKKFEYGLYENRFTGTRLLVSAGIGATFIWRRYFCPPEIVVVDLV